MVVKAILFDDGSFDGDAEASATLAGKVRGREIQMGRFLELLRKTAPAADESAERTLENLRTAVNAFRIDVDPQILDEMSAQFKISSEKRKAMATSIMDGLRLARTHAGFWIRNVEQKLAGGTGKLDSRAVLAELEARVAKQFGTP